MELLIKYYKIKKRELKKKMQKQQTKEQLEKIFKDRKFNVEIKEFESSAEDGLKFVEKRDDIEDSSKDIQLDELYENEDVTPANIQAQLDNYEEMEEFPSTVKRIQCPRCSSMNCFEEEFPELSDGTKMNGYLCKNCGYVSNSEFKHDSIYYTNAINRLPTMVKNLEFYDEKREIYWFLAIVQTDNGYVFPEPDEKDWHWTYWPTIFIPEEEKENYPIKVDGETIGYYEHRYDIDKAQQFDKTDFYKALRAVGLEE